MTFSGCVFAFLCRTLCVVIQSMYELNVTPEFMGKAA